MLISLSPNHLSITLSPLLTALASSSFSTHEPPDGLLPSLSPILRQRVKYLSSPSSPWPHHLSQDPAIAETISSLLSSGVLEVHPLSALVEIDWDDADIKTNYQRLDIETLHAYVTLPPIGDIVVKLLWATDNPKDKVSSWKIDAVFSPTYSLPQDTSPTLATAESVFKSSHTTHDKQQTSDNNTNNTNDNEDEDEDEDEDDSYWAQYDATPNASTPVPQTSAAKGSPLPTSLLKNALGVANVDISADERAYFDMYSDVQPALDNHDPDEAADLAAAGIETTVPSSSLTGSTTFTEILSASDDSNAFVDLRNIQTRERGSGRSSIVEVDIAHPRPESVASSRGEETVERLERRVERDEVVGGVVREHVRGGLRGLWKLAGGTGMRKEEFRELVKRELDRLEGEE